MPRAHAFALLAPLTVVLLGPAALRGQAICAAPHSSPTLSGQGIGLIPPGAGWLQITAYHGTSNEFFGPDGRSRPFLADARTSTSSVFVTAAAGVTPGLEVWMQLPLHRLGYTDEIGGSTRIGIGDPRVLVRAGGALFGVDIVPVTVRAAVKLPGSEFPVDPDILPVSEGQVDIELAVEAGRVLAGTYPLHIGGWLGYRWRLENRDRARRPGDERVVRLGTGGPVGGLRWDLSFEGLWSRPPELQGFVIEGARRALVQALPTLGTRIGGVELEATARLSLWGRNLPSGPSFTLAVLLPWMIS